ncbi:uncharacterized protein TNCV_876821 [Trichonephila clavipes]|nr:uncharacterized protein TNCV_876821 [Trichonephila clavipes]
MHCMEYSVFKARRDQARDKDHNKPSRPRKRWASCISRFMMVECPSSKAHSWGSSNISTRRVEGVSPLLLIGWWYLSLVSLKRHCYRVSDADKGWWAYPLDPRPDAVELYSGCTPDCPLTASPHKSLNSSRGVISEPDLLCTSESEILEEISAQGVIQIKVNDWVLVKTHPLSSAARKVVAKFKPKFEGTYRVLGVKQNNLVVWRSGKRERERITGNVGQVRLYHHRKSDEMEIRTSSSDNNSSSYKSINFKGMQLRSNESQYSRKNGSGDRRELEEKGTGIKKDQGERHTSIASNRRPLVRSSPGSWTEPNRRAKKCRKETLILERGNSDAKYQRLQLATKKRCKGGVRPANEKMKQGETTVQTLRRGAKKVKQQEYQKQKWSTTALPGEEGGANSNRSLSLEVLVGDVNYKTKNQGLYGFIIHFSDRQSGELLQHESHILVL